MADFSLELNADQLRIKDWVHEFAAEVIRPVAPEWDEREETPWPLLEEAARIGLYSWDFVANAFMDPTGLMFPLVSEELGWGDAGMTLTGLGTTLGVLGIVGNGTPEQIGEWVPECFGTPDDVHVAAFAVSEADAGSDVSSLRTRAEYDEAKDDWVRNGTKTWITNGITDRPCVHVVVATIDPELKGRGQASFVVPPSTPGVRQGKKFKKMGVRASHTAEVVLDDVRVPGRCLLGGKEFTAGEGSMAKLFAGETAVKVTEETIQVLGGAGYVKDHPVEQWHRDLLAEQRRASTPQCGYRADTAPPTRTVGASRIVTLEKTRARRPSCGCVR
jgi:alkylation response protein AidB-like acyl-CoA dehydrogenase